MADIPVIEPKCITNTSPRSPAMDVLGKNKEIPLVVGQSKVSARTPAIHFTQRFLSKRKAFHTTDTLKSLAIIEQYEGLGVKSDLQFPRIILVGNPSCGKSNLLERLTGLEFPVGFGTRFPIEIVLRRNSQSFTIIPQIILDPAAPRPSSFDPEILQTIPGDYKYDETMTLLELGALLKKVSEILGVQSLSTSAKESGSNSSHMLQINISGPGLQNLNIIDTPGFVPVYESFSVSHSFGSEIANSVCSLMREERNIILAVTGLPNLFNATRDLKIIDMEREVDKRQTRTLKAITRCENVAIADSFMNLVSSTIRDGNTKQRCYIVSKRLGLEAEGFQSNDTTFEEELRRRSQAGSAVGELHMGLSSLQADLSNLYHNELRQDILLVQQKAQTRLNKKRAQLLEPDSGLSVSWREQLKAIVEEYQKYKLRSMEIDQNEQNQSSAPQLLIYQKLAVQKKTMLRDALRTRGAKRTFGDASADKEMLKGPSGMESEGEVYPWILKRHREAKSCSIPGLVAPALIESLFQEQTSKWREITQLFLDTVEVSFEAAVYHCLEKACHDNGLAEGLADLLYDAVKSKMRLLRTRCNDIIENERRGLELISSEETFIKEIREAKTSRFISALTNLEDGANRRRGRSHSPSPSIFSSQEAHSSSFTSKLLNADTAAKVLELPKTPTRSPRTSFSEINTPPVTGNNTPNFATLPCSNRPQQESKTLADLTKINRDQVGEILSSEKQLVFEIHDILKAYYNISLQHFVDVVCKNEISHKFVADMMDVLSTEFVSGLSEAAVGKIFAGSEMRQQKIRALQAEIKSLEEVIAESEAYLKGEAKKVERK